MELGGFLGFWGLGFRVKKTKLLFGVSWVWGLGFRVLGFGVLGFLVLGFLGFGV